MLNLVAEKVRSNYNVQTQVRLPYVIALFGDDDQTKIDALDFATNELQSEIINQTNLNSLIPNNNTATVKIRGNYITEPVYIDLPKQ